MTDRANGSSSQGPTTNLRTAVRRGVRSRDEAKRDSSCGRRAGARSDVGECPALPSGSPAAENSHRDGRPPTLPDGGRLAAQTGWFAYLRLADERPALRVPARHARGDRGLSVKRASISQAAVDRFD